MTNFTSLVLGAVLATGCMAPLAFSQPGASSLADGDDTTISGTVASASRDTIVVKAENGAYHLYIFDRDTVKPATIGVGAAVKVTSRPSGETGVRIASLITVSTVAPTSTTGTTQQSSDVIPPSVKEMERDINRQVRKYGAGFRAGAALDPELLLIGVHARLGPVFNRDVSFRPNVEFAFGEVTKLFAINLEGIYRLPFAPRGGRWSPYVGLGPSFVFSHENFDREDEVDFGDFSFDAGLNILTGIQYRNGMFLEAKTTVWTSPHLRLIFGFTF